MVDKFSKNSGVTEAIVKTENIPSQRVFEKLGWEKKILYTKK
jgi:RimJ/RimL family protein N-acetyltransferase